MTSRRSFLRAAGTVPLGAAAAEFLRPLTHAEPCMGTMFQVTLHARDEAAGYEAIRHAFRRAHELDAKLSDYRDSSELSALMRDGHSRPFAASDDLFRVLMAAQNLARQTEGRFDVSIGPLSRLWRRCREQRRLPEATELAEARARVGYRQLALNPENRTVTLQSAGVQIDLGGVAKGFAADEMVAVLRRMGSPSALVAAGGDIAVGGPPPGTDAWRVLVVPGSAAAKANVALSLCRQAVSTSGAHQQHVTIAGKTYSHILDPRSGLGLTEPIAVSVVAATAMESDALATAASAMGARDALDFLSSRPGIHGRIFVLSDRPEYQREFSTPGFAKLLAFDERD